MEDETQHLEHAKWLSERTLGWIATADVKAGAAVACAECLKLKTN